MIKVAVCDNDAEEVTRIKNLVMDYEDIRVFTYIDPLKLFREIKNGSRFQIYLLDIVMPGMDGLELAEYIREHDSTAFVIFMTSHSNHALQAFKVRAFHFLVKPIDTQELIDDIRRAREFISQRDQTLFTMKTSEGIVAIPYYKIVYCYVENRCIICIDNEGRSTKSSTLRVPFSQIMAPLLDDGSFIQTHISFVVNLDYAISLKGHNFMMKDSSLVPISQKHYKEVKERYMAYVFGGE